MVQTILPKKDLEYDDIRDTLNANGGSVTNDVQTAFAENAKINPWSKHKPVNLKLDFPDINSEWWKGDNMKCGMNIGVKQPDGNITDLMKLDDVKNSNWFYEPVNKANPLRMQDFLGYASDAEPALGTGIDKEIVTANAVNPFYPIYISTNIGVDPDYLTVDDLNFSLEGLYVGAAIKGIGTHNAWREFRGGLVLGQDNDVEIKTSNLDDGEYEAVVFLADSPNPDEGRYMPLPKNDLNRTSFTLKVGFKYPYVIDLQYIARGLNSAYTDINTIEDNKPYKVGNGAVYFKGVVRRKELNDVNTVEADLKGYSSNFELGEIEQGLFNCIYDENKQLVKSIPTPGPNIGDTVPIYVKWDGYTGKNEPTDPQPMDGALDIRFSITPEKKYYIGGAPGFLIKL